MVAKYQIEKVYYWRNMTISLVLGMFISLILCVLVEKIKPQPKEACSAATLEKLRETKEFNEYSSVIIMRILK